MKLYRLFIVLCVGLGPLLARADGAIMPVPDYYMYETGQTAAIFYESDTQTETLVVGMTYQGTAKEFAWLIPTPNKPEVERGSRTLFSEISDLIYGDRNYDYYATGSLQVEEFSDVGSGVNVVEEKQIDYYDVTVLEATSGQDLLDWLNDNGYTYPTEKQYILNDYVTAGWYFTAMKINAASLDRSVGKALHTGQAVPVQLTFTTANLVYPLRISAVTDDTSTYQSITLYIFDDHKVEASGFYEDYADWVKKDKITNLAHDTNGNPWVEPANKKYFLTQLSASLTPSEMTDDVFPTDAEDNSTIDYYGTHWTASEIAQVLLITIIIALLIVGATIVTPIGLIDIAASIVRFKTKSRGWQLAAHITQWVVVSFALLLAILTVIALWNELFDDIDYYWNSSYEKSTLGVSFGVALGLAISIGVLFALPIIQSIVRWRRTKSN